MSTISQLEKKKITIGQQLVNDWYVEREGAKREAIIRRVCYDCEFYLW